MDDVRWPWLILVPELEGVEEIHKLPQDAQQALTIETSETALALKNLTGCDKINSGALGNMVRQLHIHIIARNEEDPNWPGPVWGFGTREPYNETYRRTFLIKLREELRLINRFEG